MTTDRLRLSEHYTCTIFGMWRLLGRIVSFDGLESGRTKNCALQEACVFRGSDLNGATHCIYFCLFVLYSIFLLIERGYFWTKSACSGPYSAFSA